MPIRQRVDQDGGGGGGVTLPQTAQKVVLGAYVWLEVTGRHTRPFPSGTHATCNSRHLYRFASVPCLATRTHACLAGPPGAGREWCWGTNSSPDQGLVAPRSGSAFILSEFPADEAPGPRSSNLLEVCPLLAAFPTSVPWDQLPNIPMIHQIHQCKAWSPGQLLGEPKLRPIACPPVL